MIHESSMSLTNVWYFLSSMWKDFYLLPCRKFPVTGEVNICCIFAWITAFFHYSRLLYCHVVDLRWGSSIILINFTWVHNRLCPWTPPPPRVHFLKWKKLIVFCAQCSILYFENVSLVLCLSPPIKRFFFCPLVKMMTKMDDSWCYFMKRQICYQWQGLKFLDSFPCKELILHEVQGVTCWDAWVRCTIVFNFRTKAQGWFI